MNKADKILIDVLGTLIVAMLMILILGSLLTGVVWVFDYLWGVIR